MIITASSKIMKSDALELKLKASNGLIKSKVVFCDGIAMRYVLFICLGVPKGGCAAMFSLFVACRL